eukprot:CAMPEP_0117612182 /NCGR_PEP_ID=MMETSP0784-20121206/82811_1 /TAXON_ID=39447 /ORGANISM="" /LENGTH=62 /DNA_ID=CAMNT_0005415717 /DNA_START=44 /DNA_END=229 /DNA_ORIENTATION=+
MAELGDRRISRARMPSRQRAMLLAITREGIWRLGGAARLRSREPGPGPSGPQLVLQRQDQPL